MCDRHWRASMACALFAGSVGCGAALAPRGYPLHPPGEAGARYALLKGPIADVDGRDVSAHGDLFELLPGCHVVTTVSEWNDNDQQVGVTVRLQPLIYALRVQPGNHYLISFSAGTTNTLTANFRVDAREEDANGKLVRQLEPATAGELRACQGGSANE